MALRKQLGLARVHILAHVVLVGQFAGAERQWMTVNVRNSEHETVTERVKMRVPVIRVSVLTVRDNARRAQLVKREQWRILPRASLQQIRHETVTARRIPIHNAVSGRRKVGIPEATVAVFARAHAR